MSEQQHEQFSASRTISASPSEIFAVLSDPERHQDTEPTDWVRGAIDPALLTEVGQVFGINMFHPAAGGDYQMHNTVTVLEPDHTIAWEPGQLDADGNLGKGGWLWRYDLTPADAGTDVILTYDWSATPQVVRDSIGGLPPFGPDFLDQSLAALDQAVTTL